MPNMVSQSFETRKEEKSVRPASLKLDKLLKDLVREDLAETSGEYLTLLENLLSHKSVQTLIGNSLFKEVGTYLID